MRLPPVGVVLLLAVLPASLAAQQVRDSAGVRIITYQAGYRPSHEWRVDTRPMVEIGGAAGEGPTEFTNIMQVAQLPNGTIVAANMGTNELRFFTSAGKFVRQFAPPTDAAALRSGVIGVLGNGALVYLQQEEGPHTPEGMKLPLYGSVALRNDQGEFHPIVTKVMLAKDGVYREAFLPRRHNAVLPNSICTAWGASYEVRCHRADGVLALVIRRTVTPAPVNAIARKAWDSVYVTPFAGEVGAPSAGLIEHGFTGSGIWNPVPLKPTRWSVFAPDGSFLATTTLPARFRAFEFGRDYVLGVSRDADEVERITQLRLRRQ